MGRKDTSIFEPVYLIREVGKFQYEIAKFTDDTQPEAVYHVYWNGMSGSCDCPASWRDGGGPTHKHCLMVAEWIATGKPLPVMVQLIELGLISGDDMHEHSCAAQEAADTGC